MKTPKGKKSYQIIAGSLLALSLLIASLFAFSKQIEKSDLERIKVKDQPTPKVEVMELLAEFVSSEMQGVVSSAPGGISTWMDGSSDGVYISLRANGIEQAKYWTGEGDIFDVLSDGIRSSLGFLPQAAIDEIDSVELCFSHSYKKIVLNQLPTNVDRGILGLKLNYGDQAFAISPTEMLAKNLSFATSLSRILEQLQISEAQLSEIGIVEIFECEQVIVFLDPVLKAERMVRGNQIVAVESIDLESIRQFADLASNWLTAQVQEDGRLKYKYWPSRGKESEANNMIRQWMATLAIDRLIAGTGEQELADLSKLNIEYNLENFYVNENGLGLIDFNENVKLGAIALAGLAIFEHPNAADYSAELESLNRSVDYLWREDGSFQTFYRPESRIAENQNFYPGEALLFWSALYEQSRDPELLEKIMRSFQYYRNWHRENTNPAFIPWHTQAYYNVWLITGDPELKDFIFEMNDWLTDYQEVDRSLYPDTQGRFYDAGRPQYGPPHASSTGVYLEGLVDAYLLAKETGDSERQETYANAIRYGIRSLMQLQFVNDIDMYYIHQTENVLGGLRTTVYNNSIRIDNVQHGLMAVLKILQNPEAQTIFD